MLSTRSLEEYRSDRFAKLAWVAKALRPEKFPRCSSKCKTLHSGHPVGLVTVTSEANSSQSARAASINLGL